MLKCEQRHKTQCNLVKRICGIPNQSENFLVADSIHNENISLEAMHFNSKACAPLQRFKIRWRAYKRRWVELPVSSVKDRTRPK